jgi:SAM-dependent methyltransferase
MNNFLLYSQYYDLLYQTKDYGAEANFVYSRLKKYQKDIQTIIELGSGTGNHALHLCKNGITILGVERSDEMVVLAKQKKIENYHPYVADITCYELSKQADAVISLFHVISYLNDNDDLLKCFSQTNKHLKKGGIFLFDVWYSPAVYFQKPETRIKRLSNQQIDVTRIAEPTIHYNNQIVDVNYELIIRDKTESTVSVFLEKHPMRHFSINEIKWLADLTGFELLTAEEFLTGNEASENTWGVCFILRKK